MQENGAVVWNTPEPRSVILLGFETVIVSGFIFPTITLSKSSAPVIVSVSAVPFRCRVALPPPENTVCPIRVPAAPVGANFICTTCGVPGGRLE